MLLPRPPERLRLLLPRGRAVTPPRDEPEATLEQAVETLKRRLTWLTVVDSSGGVLRHQDSRETEAKAVRTALRVLRRKLQSIGRDSQD